MKNFRLIMVLALSASFVACQKQQTEQERGAEVDRQVQERLAAERQQQQAQELAQREASVREREQALNAQQATSTPEATVAREETVARESTSEREPAGSYSMFYTKLEPYGDWIETDDYGYVYRPREAENNRWRPYTNGRWVYTDAGWTWISEEPFGWATYHYGRWTRLHGVGWVWVPGNEWAPAWVSWRKGGQYVGWAPLPPEAHFDRASGIHNWSDSYYDIGPDQYVFVPTTDIGDERVERVIVPEQQNVTIVNQTMNVTNITYNNTVIMNQGPNYDELHAQSRRPIQRLRLQRDTVVPGDGAHAIVRGEVVAIPAPLIAAQRAPERPRTVKQTIKKAAVDLGWGAVSNQREADQARAKMKSEATPPSNAPSKKFVKPAAVAAVPAASAAIPSKATVAATSAPVRASAAPTATATARAIQTPAATPVRTAPPASPVSAARPSATTQPASPPMTATPSATTRPSPPARPAMPSATTRLHLTPLPATTPAPTVPPVSTPTASTPPRSPGAVAPPNVHHTPPARVSPSVAFSPPPQAPQTAPESASPSASATPTPPAGEQRGGERKRPLPRRERPGEATASPSVTPQ